MASKGDRCGPPFPGLPDPRFDDVDDREQLRPKLERARVWFDAAAEMGVLPVPARYDAHGEDAGCGDGGPGWVAAGCSGLEYAVIRHTPGRAAPLALVMCTGWSETFLKFKELAFDLVRGTDEPCDVFLMDHRSQGLSGRLHPNPQVTWVHDFDDYVHDLLHFVDRVVTGTGTKTGTQTGTQRRPRVHFYAHSMGGLIGTRAAIQRPGIFDRMVLSAPMLGIDPMQINQSPYVRALFPPWAQRCLAELACCLGYGGTYLPGCKDLDTELADVGGWRLQRGDLNRCTSTWGRMSEYEWHVRRTVPRSLVNGPAWRWLRAAYVGRLDSGTLTREDVEALGGVPILVFQAGEEKLVNNRTIVSFHQAVPSCRRVLVAGAKHELHMERDEYRDGMVANIAAFFNAAAPQDVEMRGAGGAEQGRGRGGGGGRRRAATLRISTAGRDCRPLDGGRRADRVRSSLGAVTDTVGLEIRGAPGRGVRHGPRPRARPSTNAGRIGPDRI
jgi:lysophospholipase